MYIVKAPDNTDYEPKQDPNKDYSFKSPDSKFKYFFKEYICPFLLAVGVLFLLVGGMVKCNQWDIRRIQAYEKSITVDDSTFVDKVDGMYIHRVRVGNHEMYRYSKIANSNSLKTIGFTHSPDCPCKNQK